MLITKSEIINFIPQRSPMIMVDNLVACSETSYTSQFCPLEENIFNEKGFFNESGLIENMAQTAALGVGYFALKENKNVLLGFIGAVKNLQIYHQLEIGKTILTKINIMYKILNATIAKAEIFQKHELIAQSEFKIFINPVMKEK